MTKSRLNIERNRPLTKYIKQIIFFHVPIMSEIIHKDEIIYYKMH